MINIWKDYENIIQLLPSPNQVDICLIKRLISSNSLSPGARYVEFCMCSMERRYSSMRVFSLVILVVSISERSGISSKCKYAFSISLSLSIYPVGAKRASISNSPSILMILSNSPASGSRLAYLFSLQIRKACSFSSAFGFLIFPKSAWASWKSSCSLEPTPWVLLASNSLQRRKV